MIFVILEEFHTWSTFSRIRISDCSRCILFLIWRRFEVLCRIILICCYGYKLAQSCYIWR